MKLPAAPQHMFDLRGQTVKNFSYDNTNQASYTFNSLGYRGSEFINKNPIILLGNSISFGLGLDREKTFAGLIETKINLPVYNFSWGGFAHTNHEQLQLANKILTKIKPKFVIWQINNLDRIRIGNTIIYNNNVDLVENLFNDFIYQAKNILDHVPHIFLYWDDKKYNIDFSFCLINNRYHIDTNKVNQNSFGTKSHKLIAEKILKYTDEKL